MLCPVSKSEVLHKKKIGTVGGINDLSGSVRTGHGALIVVVG